MKDMKNIASLILFSTFFLLFLPIGNAYTSKNIALLTVSESANDTEVGGIANLQLVVEPGSGRIFIDSFPLSKIDTQITFRFAAEVACNLLEKDCSGYDFFYTVTANTGLVGGPSAGAAATVLTVALLDDQELDNHTIMTGTINSGNLIGPVGGIPAKILAAQEHGYEHVLIPEWDMSEILEPEVQGYSDDNHPDDDDNNSSNLTSSNLTYGHVLPDINVSYEDFSIDIIPVSTLEESLYHFTGKNYSKPGLDGPVYSAEYVDMMKNITLGLCTRYGSMMDGKIVLPNLTHYDVNETNSSRDNFLMALGALENGSYYSAASLCFGGNVKIKTVLLKNLTDAELKLIYAQTLTDTDRFIRELGNDSKTLSTISELETYMIVSERAQEAKKLLSNMDPDNISAQQLAYVIERLDTAKKWSTFSRFPGPKFVMDNELMMIACTKKLAEAEERLNYLDLYYLDNDLRRDLSVSYDYYSDDNYALCIFTASKVKADADIVLSAIFIPEGELDKLFYEKISAAQRVMNRQKGEGIFPILGYSYYEYANTLKPTDEYSALLYAEYALELSNIDMYFRKYEPLSVSSSMFSDIFRFQIYAFVLGILAGIIISAIFITLFIRSRKVKKKIHRR